MQDCGIPIVLAMEKPQSCTKSLIDGLVQDCSNPIAKALELLQSSTNPSNFSNMDE